MATFAAAAETSGASSSTFPSTVRGKLDRAEAIRIKGGERYAAKKYKSAVRQYAQIPAWVSPFAVPAGGDPTAAYGEMMGQGGKAVHTKAEQLEAQTLMRIAHQNSAMCYVKMKDGARALASCEKAFKYDDGSMWKVHRTRAHAYILLRDLDEAQAALDKVTALIAEDPELSAKTEDKITKKLEILLKKMFAQHEKRERKKYKNAFGV